MSPHEKLQRRISEIIARPKSIEFGQIEWVMNQLGASSRKTKHGVIFKISGCSTTLMVNEHNNGKKHLPPYCIADFSDLMIELGLYAPDESL
jgi:hypothetical protein